MAVESALEDRGGARAKRRLQPLLTVVQGPHKFLSTSSTYWYPPFVTKVLELTARFSVQIDETLTIDPS